MDDLFRRRHLYATNPALLSLIGTGEGSELEFKSTMRWNLKADRAGKEIELAWLKTVVAYLNSDGGILLIGVRDDGNIVGLDADRFQNDDKCLLHFNNLMNQHNGLEFSPFVSFEMCDIENQKVLIVECGVSRQPVFLKTGKDEAYFIRSGPSSAQLSMRAMLKYLNEEVN